MRKTQSTLYLFPLLLFRAILCHQGAITLYKTFDYVYTKADRFMHTTLYTVSL